MADQKITQLTELATLPDPTDEFLVVDKSDTTMAATGTNKRIKWSNAGGGMIPESIINLKGDLLVGLAADSITRKAVGADDTILMASSGDTGGVKWAAAATPTAVADFTAPAEGTADTYARSDHNHGLPIWGMYPTYVPLAAPVSTATGVANTYYTLPIRVMSPTTITGVEFKNGGTMNGNVRCAFYDIFGTKVADRTSDLAQAGTANTRRRVPFTSTYAALPGSYSALLWFSSATATAFMAPVLGTVGTTSTNATTTPTTPTPAVDLTTVLVPMFQVY